MQSFSVLFLAFFVLDVIATPFLPWSPPKVDGRSFKVARVASGRTVKRDGAAELMKSYAKYGMPIPAALRKRKLEAASKSSAGLATATTGGVSAATNTASGSATGSAPAGSQSGSVAASPEAGDIEYLSPVVVGGQTMNMDFDSGSSDLWVFNTALPAADTTGHTVYDPTKSKTFKAMTGSTFSISYGDGSGAAGTVGTDTVNIGGATFTSQAIELATAVSASFVKDTQSNGLVGLAYSKLNTVKPTQQKTFLDNMKDQLASPIFTANLKAGTAGAYEFGAIDNSKYSGNLRWSTVNTTNGFWQFSSQSATVNGGTPVLTQGGQAIADTGTTLMLVAPATVDAYYSQVQGATNSATDGGVVFPCNSKLPDLAVDIGGMNMAVVPGRLINFTQVDATNCFGGVQATTSNLQIYGDILFKSNFVVFNAGNNSIAMAPHN